MSWEPVGFMFFSGIEAFSLYFLIMCLFRFRFQEHVWQALSLTLLINLQSYVLRNDFTLGNIMPLVTIGFFVLFFAVFVRMSLVLSLLSTISGYVIFGVVQTGIAILLFGSIDAAKSGISNGYILQSVSGVLIISGAWLVYRLGYGFSFDLNKLKFKFEDISVILLIMLFLISISSVLYYNETYINILYFAVTSAYLLYYAIRKDQKGD